MTIDSITGRLHSTPAVKTGQKNSIETEKSTAASKAPEDSIELSTDSPRISKALDLASALPAVDNDRVAAVKQALANGSYAIDAQKIAQKMTEFDFSISQNST